MAYDYSQHFIKSHEYKWLEDYRRERGSEVVEEYQTRIYNHLLGLEPEVWYPFDNMIKYPENTDLFIKTVCMFIYTDSRYHLSDDYTQIRRYL